MKKNFIVIMALCVYGTLVHSLTTLDTVLVQYEQALRDLVTAHQAVQGEKKVRFDQASIIASTLQKIVGPQVSYIQGYAQVVRTEFQGGFDYHEDLHNVFQNCVKYQQEVKRLVGYFPEHQRVDVQNFLYQLVGQEVVQIAWDIVHKLSYQLLIDPQSLTSCYVAYQICIGLYVSTMHIFGVPVGADISDVLVTSMDQLYQAAIVQRQNDISSQLHDQKLQDAYAEIEAYYKILASVYQLAGHDNQAQMMTSQAQAVAVQASQYTQAQAMYKQALVAAQSARAIIDLQVMQTQAVVSQVSAAQQGSVQAHQAFERAVALFSQAQDAIGQQRCDHQMLMIINVDMVVRTLQQLWLLYLQDQSSNNVATAPSLMSKNDRNTVISALQNMIDLIEKTTNNVNQLAQQSDLQQFSIQKVVTLLSDNLQLATAGGVQSSLVTMPVMQQAQIVVQYVQNMAQAMINAMSSDPQDSVAQAMTYAQALDGMYSQKSNGLLMSLVPYLPMQLGKQATWQSWVATILLNAQVVTSLQQAQALAGTVKITQPVLAASDINIASTKQQASNAQAKATQYAQKGDFEQAMAWYGKAYSLYQSLYAAQIAQSDADLLYEQAMYLRTMFTAMSFASTVSIRGDITWGTIKNIPTAFTASSYQFEQIAMSDFGGAILPESFQGIAAGEAIENVSIKQQEDMFELLKAYMVSQILQVQGLNFTDCFADYQLNLKSGASDWVMKYAKQAIAQVETAMNNFTDCAVKSFTLQDASTIQLVNCTNIPMQPVKPLFANMATVATFLESSYLLLKPSAQTVDVGGTRYVPGNDAMLADYVLQDLVKVYVFEAYEHYLFAQKQMALVTKTSPQGQLQQALPHDFADILNDVSEHIVRAQALLYAPQQSAYFYAQQSNSKELAQAVEKLFVQMYAEQVSWMQQCLIGTPFSNNYQKLLYDINTTFINWASVLNAQQDALKITQFNERVAKLFQQAGDLCMKVTYRNPLYPTMNQYHYAVAAYYFSQARQKYLVIKNTTFEENMNALMNYAYYQGAYQNIMTFLNVLQQGVVYTAQATGAQTPVSFVQMQQDAMTGFVDSGEQDAYDAVKNLLLNAGMTYEYLSDQRKVSATIQPKGQQSPHQQFVIPFLQKTGLMGASTVEVPYFGQGFVAKLFAQSKVAYTEFSPNVAALQAWTNTLLQGVETLYAQNYLGVQSVTTGSAMAKEVQAFFQALQSAAVGLQNRSAAYVG